MRALAYERPNTVEAALQSLAAGGARPLAGGTDLIPQLREGRRAADRVVDLKHVPELTSVVRTADGAWRIGAAASITRLGRATELVREHPGVIEAARLVGSLQIQSRATLGGNICNGAPSADAVPLLMSLGADVEIAGPGGRRTVPLESLPRGPGRTALAEGELVVAVLLPPKPVRSAARYLRFTPRREMDIAIAGAGVTLALSEAGEVASVRITLASVGPVPIRAAQAEARLLGAMPTAEAIGDAARLASADASPISDTRGSAGYRRDLVAVLTRRAIEACLADIGREGDPT